MRTTRSRRSRPTCWTQAVEYREKLIETISENDDEAMEAYLVGEELTARRS